MRKLVCGSLLAAGLLAVQSASATVLTFDTPRNNNEVVTNWDKYYSASPLNAYGDSVDFGVATTGSTPLVDGANTYTLNYNKGNGWTPNVDVDYGSAAPNAGDGVARIADPNPVSNGFGNPVAWLDSDSNYPANPHHKFYFTFTPDPGYAVRVNSYDLINYSFGAHSSEITIYQDLIGGPLMVPTYADNNTGSGPGNTTNYNLVAGGSVFYGGTVVLQVEHINGINWTLALDNLNFDQQLVPEPATLGLLAIGGLALLRRRA